MTRIAILMEGRVAYERTVLRGIRDYASREAPDWMLRLLGLFDKTVRLVLPTLGHETPINNTQAAEVLGIEFIDARTAIKTSAAALIREGLVS